MTTKKIEKRIENFFTAATEVQRQALSFGKQNFFKALEQEITIRNLLSNAFENSLSILGKGIVYGRKATEIFAATTHRKTNRLKKMNADVSVPNTEKKSYKRAEPNITPLKKTAPRNKKPRSHTGSVVRSH